MIGETYRDFIIHYVYPPIPCRSMDWGFYHKDYDGEGDRRHGNGPSVEDCKAQIDDWWLEQPQLTREEQRDQNKRCACRGSDDYCLCGNVPDAQTLAERKATNDR